MAGSLLPQPKQLFQDAAWNPGVAYQVYTYTSGTLTPKATYADAAMASPNANPTIANARGETLMYGSGPYRVILKDSLGNTIYDVDPVESAGSVASTLAADLASAVINKGSKLVAFIQRLTGAVARWVEDKLAESVSVFDFMTAAQIADVQAGTATLDTAAAINAASLATAGKRLYFPAGTYLVASMLTAYAGTNWYGDGMNKSVIKLSGSYAVGTSLLQNATQSGTVDTYPDKNFLFRDIGFDGNSNALRTIALVSFFKVQFATFLRCAFRNNTYMGAAIGGCKSVKFLYCEGTSLGKTVATTEGGAAIWTGTSADGSQSYDVIVDHCLFQSNNWSAMYAQMIGGAFTNNVCISNTESTVYMGPTGANILIAGNVINGTSFKTTAANGLEIWGTNVKILNNDISACASSGIALGDAYQVEIAHNKIYSNGQDTAHYPTASGIDLVSIPYAAGLASGVPPTHINIHDNFIQDQTGSQKYAIQAFNYSGGAASFVVIKNNNCSQGGATGTFRFDAGSLTPANCFVGNNISKANVLAPAFTVKSVASAAAPGTVVVTGLGFCPHAIEISMITTSTSAVQECIGASDGVTSAVNWKTVVGAAVACGPVTGAIVHLENATGTVQCAATLTSFDQDGFTLTFTTTAVTGWMLVKCYP